MMQPFISLLYGPAAMGILHDLLALAMGCGSVWCFVLAYRGWRKPR
jgi:hypothetical protein